MIVTKYYHGEAQHFSYWWKWEIFLDFHAYVAAVKSINLHWVSLWFKNPKWIIPQWSHHTHSITFLQWSSTFGVCCGESSLSIHCLVIKDPFFINCNDVLEKQVISLHWKKTCCYGYAIFILLTKSMKNPNT